MSHGSVHGTKRVGDDGLDETEPLEEVGPAKSDATAELCEKTPGDVAYEKAHESEHTASDELAEQFPTEMIPMVAHPVDGLPLPANERHGLALAAPFTIDHVVCVEDDRQFVEVFEEEMAAYEERYGKLHRRLKYRNRRERYDEAGSATARVTYEPSEIVERFGHRVHEVKADDGSVSDFVIVRPLRERCIHYKRQVFANDEVQDEAEFGHRIVFRNCAIRRSVGGAFMSLRDEAVYACDYREPADPVSVAKYLDEEDTRRLRSADHLKHLPLFGLTGEPHEYVAKATTPTVAVVEPNGAAAPPAEPKGVTP